MSSPSRDAAPAPSYTPPSDLAARVERLERLERRAEEPPPPPPPADKGGKDVWDVIQIVGGALIPVAIAAGGWFYSEASSQAQIESARQQHQRDTEIAVAESRVKQAGLLKDFLDALTGPDAAKQRVAIQAVLLALPEDGPRLVRELSRSPDPGVAAFASASLTDRCQALVQRLFAPTSEERVAAARALIDGWGDSPVLLDKLLPYARQHLADGNGVFNTLGVLNETSPALLVRRRADVEAFVAEAERSPAAGDLIRLQAARLRARIRSAA